MKQRLLKAAGFILLALFVIFSPSKALSVKGNWIEIVQGQQMLYVKDADDKILYSTTVITGRSGLVTLQGIYTITELRIAKNIDDRKEFKPDWVCEQWSKGKCIKYKLQRYYSWVWARLGNTGRGLHDANWWPGWNESQKFAQRIFASGQGSHGCINIPSTVIWKVRSYLYGGMKVVVRGSRTSPQ